MRNVTMARNFKIQTRHNHRALHLQLTGDFDGSSACELLSALEDCLDTANRVYVHTKTLHEIHMFGRMVFEKGFSRIRKLCCGIVLKGEKLVV